MIRNQLRLMQMSPDEQAMALFEIVLEDQLRPSLLLAKSDPTWKRIKAAYLARRRELLNTQNAAKAAAKAEEEAALEAAFRAHAAQHAPQPDERAPDGLFYGPAEVWE